MQFSMTVTGASVDECKASLTALAAALGTTAAPVVPPVVPPAPSALLTSIPGAKLNGTLQSPLTFSSLVTLMKPGDVLELPNGKFLATSAISTKGLTIKGQPAPAKTILDCTGVTPNASKGIINLETGCDALTLIDLSLTGASISTALGANAAGIRVAWPAMNFTLERVEIFGCQDGILTAGGAAVGLKWCFIHENGSGNGQTHEVYFGSEISVDAADSVFRCGLKSTHAYKSRALTNRIARCLFVGNGDNGAVGGAVISISDGGVVEISDSTIEIPAGAGNHNFLVHGIESNNNGPTGSTVTLRNVVLKGNTTPGLIQSRAPGATLILDNVTYTAASPPSVSGMTVQGQFVKAA